MTTWWGSGTGVRWWILLLMVCIWWDIPSLMHRYLEVFFDGFCLVFCCWSWCFFAGPLLVCLVNIMPTRNTHYVPCKCTRTHTGVDSTSRGVVGICGGGAHHFCKPVVGDRHCGTSNTSCWGPQGPSAHAKYPHQKNSTMYSQRASGCTCGCTCGCTFFAPINTSTHREQGWQQSCSGAVTAEASVGCYGCGVVVERVCRCACSSLGSGHAIACIAMITTAVMFSVYTGIQIWYLHTFLSKQSNPAKTHSSLYE